MIISIFFCFSVAVSLGESQPPQGYDRPGYENSNPHSQNSKFLDSGSEEQAPRRGALDPEVADQLEGNGWLDVIPGRPGKDYPNYEKIPETSFTCDGKTLGGYYADIEARCQVFHVCNTGGLKSTFVCPAGSIFNQKYFVCDWWYDFECDDATDLYSLNEKVNRGGTGSGPSGPGRLEETFDNPSKEKNFEVFKTGGNFVADGSDLSLAGTGEGGPGYLRNGNKGYQSKSESEENQEEEQIDGGRGQARGTNGRESLNNRKTGESLSPDNDYQRRLFHGNEEGERSEERPREFYPDSGKSRGRESGVVPETRRPGENFRNQNSPALNSGVNYQGGYGNAEPKGAPKTDNFRAGNDGGHNRAEQSNGFNENPNNPSEYSSDSNTRNENINNDGDSYPRPREESRSYERPHSFGERSSPRSRNDYFSSEPAGSDDRELSTSDSSKESSDRKNSEGSNSDGISGPSSGSDNNGYRSPAVIREGIPAKVVRGRQRNSGGLPGGLGNGYPSPGRFMELPGSDGIAGAVTPAGNTPIHDEGDQSFAVVNSRRKASPGSRTSGELEELRSTDSHKVRRDRPDNTESTINRHSDGKDHPARKIDSYDNQLSKNVKSSTRNYNSFGQGLRDDDGAQNSGKNYGDDYLVGVVPEDEDPANGTNFGQFNKPRRYLPIL